MNEAKVIAMRIVMIGRKWFVEGDGEDWVF